MFWSANYTSVRQLNILLQKENVTLSQVLEADDILQECKADNTALIKFLTRPDILAELITLITEEPPNNVELTSQYRHANIACEVLTSHLSKLSDCLSSNTEQMNRLCDFLNRDPPLNPLLASYFSKTVEMLLDRNPKQQRRSVFGYLRSHLQLGSAFSAQDWYLYHIVCLRVIDFFKSRPDFLHNLLRHMSTSAIADVFKYFIRLDLFSKNIIEWLEQNQFIESLIQIICCLYTPEELPIVTQSVNSGRDAEHIDKAEQENNEKSETLNHNHAAVDNKLTSTNINSIEENNTQDHLNHQKVDSESNPEVNSDGSRDDIHKTESVVKQEINESLSEEELQRQRVVRLQRMQAVASANAASLLCDIVETGCITNGGSRSGLSWCVVGALCSAQCAGALLQGMATSGRRAALVGGARLLRALLQHAEPALQAALPAALAPHLPLLHRALLRERAEQRRGAGEARIQLCALLAALHACTHADVVHTLLTLGTAGAAAALLARFPRCSLLHREVAALLLHALHHPQPHYKRQLLVEHDLLTLLMDLYEENETKEKPRAAYMGHVVQLLRHLQELLPAAPAPDTAPAPDAGPASEAPAAPAPDYAPASVPDAAPAPAPAPAPNAGPVSEAPAAPDAAPAPAPEAQLLAPHVAARWAAFQRDKLQPLAQLMDTPLGGSIPMDAKFQTLEDFLDEEEEKDRALEQQQTAQQQQLDEDLEQPTPATEYFLQLAAQRYHDDFSMWDDEPSADLVLPAETPWDSSPPAEVEAGWAQFPVAAPAAPPPPPPPRPQHPDEQFSPFWTYGEDQNGGAALEAALQQLQVSRLEASTRELTHNLLAAMSSMSPAALATLVHHDAWGPAEPTPADLTATRAEPSATDSEPGATDSEPSANPAEPSATNSEPSATNFEASATNSELSATNSEPNATNSEPSVTNSEPSATNFEPSATNSEPSVTNSEPSATNFEPSATNSEPSATNFDPSATNSEPSVTNSEDSDR